jgi:hypothetical protein
MRWMLAMVVVCAVSNLTACGSVGAARPKTVSQHPGGRSNSSANHRILPRGQAVKRTHINHAGTNTQSAPHTMPKGTDRGDRYAERHRAHPVADDGTYAKQRGGGPAMADVISVLARPYDAEDALPSRAREAVTLGNTAGVTEKMVVRPASARRIPVKNLPPIWVLGGAESACLLHGDKAVESNALAYAFTCMPRNEALKGRLISTSTDTSGSSSDQTVVEGVVPDGVERVVVKCGGGREETMMVRDNVYAGAIHAPLTIAFTHNGRQYEVALPQAPGSPADKLGISE